MRAPYLSLMETPQPLVRMEEITKAFPGVLANDQITFEVGSGEIHALVGENGAGKTTLMRILYGMDRADEGRIFWEGRPVEIRTPDDAIRLGVGMLHQRFQLIPSLTAAENIVLGQEPRRGIILDRAAARAMIADLVRRFRLEVDPDAKIADLSVGEQQRVEILKVLYRQARLLILDEPTAVLTPQETEDLFAVLRRLAGEGKTVIFITHKLAEVMAVSERVTVLRRGRVVGTRPTREASPRELARMIIGEAVEEMRVHRSTTLGAPALIVDGISMRDERGVPVLDNVTLSVHRGEILGIAGVEGNGQKELVEVITGVRPPDRGLLLIDGRLLTAAPVTARRAAGLAVIPEDRYSQGVSLPMTIEENVVSTRYNAFASWGVLSIPAVRRWADGLMRRFDIRAPSARVAAATLSGGNLQRVVAARELAGEPIVLVASQPTRGLDIAATRFIHEQLLAVRDHGGGVLLVSADLDEILALADRIAVIFSGRIIGEMPAAQASRERLGLLMAGREGAA